MALKEQIQTLKNQIAALRDQTVQAMNPQIPQLEDEKARLEEQLKELNAKEQLEGMNETKKGHDDKLKKFEGIQNSTKFFKDLFGFHFEDFQKVLKAQNKKLVNVFKFNLDKRANFMNWLTQASQKARNDAFKLIKPMLVRAIKSNLTAS